MKVRGKNIANISIPMVKGDIIITAEATRVISFEDPIAKQICVENWGGHYVAGEITTAEAAAVTDIAPTSSNAYFKGCQMEKFNEFQYFTGLTNLSTLATSAYGTFQECNKLKEITLPRLDMSRVVKTTDGVQVCDFSGMFRGCYSLEAIDFSPFATEDSDPMAHLHCLMYGVGSKIRTLDLTPFKKIRSLRYAFNAFYPNTIITTGCDFSGAVDFTGAFNSSLVTLTGGLSGCKVSLDFSACSNLEHDSAVGLLESLGTATNMVIQFNATTYATLSESEIAIATDKGWTVTSA